jgi:hypothetical protein
MQKVPSPPNPVPPNEDVIRPNVANEENVVSTEEGPAKDMSNTLNVSPGSIVAEEHGKDTANSNFWATYKKVSDEYDNDFLERANDDMGVILTLLVYSQLLTLHSSVACSLTLEILRMSSC